MFVALYYKCRAGLHNLECQAFARGPSHLRVNIIVFLGPYTYLAHWHWSTQLNLLAQRPFPYLACVVLDLVVLFLFICFFELIIHGGQPKNAKADFFCPSPGLHTWLLLWWPVLFCMLQSARETLIRSPRPEDEIPLFRRAAQWWRRSCTTYMESRRRWYLYHGHLTPCSL